MQAARACPLCDSPTARRVRAGLFDSRLMHHLAATVLPFPVLIAIVTLAYYGPPSPAWRRSRAAPKPKGRKAP